MRVNGAALRAIRERSGFSGPQLAKRVGCSHGTIYDLEGERNGASPALVRRLADALEVPVLALTSAADWTDEAEPEAVA